MSKHKHTPGPWRMVGKPDSLDSCDHWLCENADAWISGPNGEAVLVPWDMESLHAFISRILDADGEIVGDLRQASKPIADFLVRACNSHAKLLEACKALLDHFCGAGERTHTDASVMVLAQAAIAEAEAEGA